MRQHKFCGKRLDNAEWVTGYFTKNESNGNCYITTQTKTGGAHPHRVDPETVGEFTGRKDISGAEVYENNILGDTEGYIRGAVTWSEKELCWMIKFGPMEDELCPYHNDDIEVIGNTVDNPELVEVQS